MGKSSSLPRSRDTRDTRDSGIRSRNDMTSNFSQGNRIIARIHFTGTEFRGGAWKFVRSGRGGSGCRI